MSPTGKGSEFTFSSDGLQESIDPSFHGMETESHMARRARQLQSQVEDGQSNIGLVGPYTTM
eukprot:4956898-Amphidinium_carterae.1